MLKSVNYSSNIESISKRKGFTIDNMLQKAGINSSSYYKMKRNNKFTTETLEIIAETLDVEVSDLVKRKDFDEQKEMLEDFEMIEEKIKEYKDKHFS